MDELMKVRQQIKPLAQAAGLPNFTLMPLLVKATSLALADYPILNSQISCVSATSGDGPGRPEAMWASWHLFCASWHPPGAHRSRGRRWPSQQ